MNPSLWFYSDTQQTYGPIAAPQLIAMIQAGQLVAGHFIMPQGAQEWQYVSASPFAGYLPQAAPPAPVAPPPPPQSPQRVAGQPFRPPQQRAAAPAPTPQAVKKSRSGLIATAVVLLLAAGAGAYFGLKPSAAASGFPTATKEQPFINSLGMKFVPVPGTEVLMCMHETRKQDFAAYAAANPRVHDFWKHPMEHKKTAVSTGDDHPVVCVTAEDGDAFCEWLSKKEGRLYRLPTDEEWCMAAGISSDPEAPEANDGSKWPVEKSGMANATTLPVMSLKPNKIGIYDLAGNVIEACIGREAPSGEERSKPGKFTHFRSHRGGNFWGNGAAFSQRPSYSFMHISGFGFRVVLASKPMSLPGGVSLYRKEGCVAYNPQNLKILDRGPDGWLLTDGVVELQLLDNEQDANYALAEASEHTARCFIGSGNRCFEYWTGESGIKRGTKSPIISSKYDPSKLKVKWLEDGERSGWCVYQDEQMVTLLFDTEARAQEALAIVRKHPTRRIVGENGLHSKRLKHIDYVMESWE